MDISDCECFIFFLIKNTQMSIVIHGENISTDGTSQYVFKPTSKQVNALNHLCYGRLNTPLRSV